MKVIFFSTEKILVVPCLTTEVGEPTLMMSGFQLAAPVSGKLKKNHDLWAELSSAQLRYLLQLCGLPGISASISRHAALPSACQSRTRPPRPARSAVSCFMTGSRVDVSDAAVRLTPSPSPICQTPSLTVAGDNNC